MALFSDVDWLIILVVAAFLFFGPQGQQFARQLGRWYGRLVHLKDEILSEVATTAGVPTAPAGTAASIRSVLFGGEPAGETVVPPAPLPAPSMPGIITHVQPVGMWAVETETLGAGIGPGTWWVATTSAPGEVVRLR
jgi:hypothetical protein